MDHAPEFRGHNTVFSLLLGWQANMFRSWPGFREWWCLVIRIMLPKGGGYAQYPSLAMMMIVGREAAATDQIGVLKICIMSPEFKHTWDQVLNDHFHLHCLVPSGALSFHQSRWIPARKTFLFHYEALSRVFRGKFLNFLEKAFDRGKLQFSGRTAPLKVPRTFKRLIRQLRRKKWVVYAKKPFGSPQHVLDYLGRYTHRVALSNDRILKAQNGQVTFSFSPRLIRLRRNRDRRDRDRKKTMTLDAREFIRRFLLHIVPSGLMRIRHFGFLANRSKKQSLPQCRKLLGLNPLLPEIPDRSTEDLLLELTGMDLSRCPCCKKGTMVLVAKLPKISPWDSS